MPKTTSPYAGFLPRRLCAHRCGLLDDDVALHERDGARCELADFRILLLVSRQPEPGQRFFVGAGRPGVQPEVVVCNCRQPAGLAGRLQFVTGAVVLPRLVMCDAGVVVEQRRLHAGCGGLAVSQQCGPVQIVAEQSVTVGKQFLRGTRKSGCRRSERQQHDRENRCRGRNAARGRRVCRGGDFGPPVRRVTSSPRRSHRSAIDAPKSRQKYDVAQKNPPICGTNRGIFGGH